MFTTSFLISRAVSCCSVIALSAFAFAEESKPLTKVDLLDESLSKWEVFIGVPLKSITGLPEGTPQSDSAISGVPLGLNNDMKKVFSTKVESGEVILQITGEIYGALSSKDSYQNYLFECDFKWGERKWAPRLTIKRDSGLLYHCHGKHGAFWNVWKSCIEYQVQEKDFGDLYLLGGTSCKSCYKTLEAKQFIFDPQPTFPWETWQGQLSASHELDMPLGDWNKLKIYVLGDTAIHILNDVVVLAIIDAVDKKGQPLTSGQIQIQSEGAECYYKNIHISPIKAYPEEIAAKASLSVTGKPR